MCTHNIHATRKCTLLLQHMKFETSDGYIWFVSPLWLGYWTSLQQTAVDHHFVICLHLAVESHQLSELKCSIKTWHEWATRMGWTLRCSQQYSKDLGQTAPCKGLAVHSDVFQFCVYRRIAGMEFTGNLSTKHGFQDMKEWRPSWRCNCSQGASA
jgi:hypothetical protein